jgi:UDP-N-acetyl-D-galactosamine dehydrogenase
MMVMMGFALKKNCADFRNTRVADIVPELAAFSAIADVFDPGIDAATVAAENGIAPVAQPVSGAYDAIVLAVSHCRFVETGSVAIRDPGKPAAMLFDVKGALGKSGSDIRP